MTIFRLTAAALVAGLALPAAAEGPLTYFTWSGYEGAFAAAVPQGWTQGTRPVSRSPMILPVISS